MTLYTFFLLCALLAIALAALITIVLLLSNRRHPDPQGSLWRHIFKE